MVALNEKFNSFRDEFRFFLERYLFELLGINGSVLMDEHKQWSIDPPAITQQDSTLYFSAQRKCYFSMEASNLLSDNTDNFRLARTILESFFVFSEYKATGRKQNRYKNFVARDKAYQMAIQDGISGWVIGNTGTETISSLFDLLEKWSVKTYEGKRVTLGFIINPSYKESPTLSFDEMLTFLNDDSSAVLSDCIHSIIELDKGCNLVGYHSISDNLDCIPTCDLSDFIPIRFMQSIQRFIPYEGTQNISNKVGIFLLNNGDILLVKNGRTCFVKRNLHWLNLSHPAFENSLYKFTCNISSADKYDSYFNTLLLSVYASVLDVSFSHTGGIIAVVSPESVLELTKQQILHPLDSLSSDDSNVLINASDDTAPNSAEKPEKIVRRKLLKYLVNNRQFFNLDRKLRCELIALDGACILDYNGKIHAFGAIIKNDSGSTGGGRASAAKKLSNYGMAIKISTDGYIEVYIKSELVYSIK